MSICRTMVWLTLLSAIGFIACGIVVETMYFSGLGFSGMFAVVAFMAKMGDVLGGGEILIDDVKRY